jgi:hypothetical protein
MVKSIISTILATVLLVSLSLIEQSVIKNTFFELKENLTIVYAKTENQTAIKDDILAYQKFWIQKKEFLHVFIPHNEIKEMDLWIGESCTLIENKKYEDALSKLDVVMELIEQIPKTFALRVENVL